MSSNRQIDNNKNNIGKDYYLMNQKFLHEHSLSKNLINNKLREEMYLRHLREVEKINNREADSLRKQLKTYRSISSIHKNNKRKAFYNNLKEKQTLIEEKNIKIHSKIQSIACDQLLKAQNTKLRSSSFNIQANSGQVTLEKESKENKEVEVSQKGKEKKALQKQSFHYRYRKRQQQMIQGENVKLMKAILSQKSTILPIINNKKSRMSQDLSKSKGEIKEVENKLDTSN